MRRFFDLGILLIFSVPILILFLFIFVFCFLFQGTPIFFSQDRGGFKIKIKIYKFRSMKKVNNNNIVTNGVSF